MTKIVAKVLVFYKADEQHLVLVLKGSLHSSAPGLGDLPGGKIEDNESIEEGAKREVLEETGLCLQELHSICSYTMPHPSGILKEEHLFCAITDIQKVMINPEEHCASTWASLDFIDDCEIHPVTLYAIQENRENIEKLLTTLF